MKGFCAVVILVLAMAALTAGTPMMLGSNPCTWGPAYWCHTIEKGHECGMVEWCTSKKMGFAAEVEVILPPVDTTTAEPPATDLPESESD